MKILKFLVLLVLLVSCQEQLNTPVTIQDDVEKLDFTTYSENVYRPEFTQEFADSLIQIKVIKDSTRPSTKRNIFHGITKRLGLDSTQQVITDSLIFNHQNCVQDCISLVKVEERKIIDSSKIAIELVNSELKLGLITRFEARKKISEINNFTKASILNLNVRFKVRECMENCDTQFISEFSKVLNPTQLKKFNDWLFNNKLPKDKKKDRG
jgi:hypothetical protein